MKYAILCTPSGVLPFYWVRGKITTCYLGHAHIFSNLGAARVAVHRLRAAYGRDDLLLTVVEICWDRYGLPFIPGEGSLTEALAPGTRRAETAKRVRREACQSGPKGNAHD